MDELVDLLEKKTVAEPEFLCSVEQGSLSGTRGLINQSATCWLNTMVQTIYSMSVFNHTLNKKKQVVETQGSALAKVWLHLIGKLRPDAPEDIKFQKDRVGITLLEIFRAEISRHKVSDDTNGQQSPINNLIQFIELFDIPDIINLFNCRYHTVGKCKCGGGFDRSEGFSPIRRLRSDINLMTNMVAAVQQTTEIINDWYCESCKVKTNLAVTFDLRRAPPIFIFEITKGQKYPSVFVLRATDTTWLHYRLISVIVHIGATSIDSSFGHYKAITLVPAKKFYPGKAGRIYVEYDDTVVTPGVAPESSDAIALRYELEKTSALPV